MLNKIRTVLFFFVSVFIYQTISGQVFDSDIIQVKVLYESLEFNRAINSGQRLLKSNQELNKEELVTIHNYMALSFYNIGKIDSARSHFLTLLSIQPDFELDPINVSPKIISFFEQIKKEVKKSQTENTIGYTKYVFLEDLRPAATFRSALIPGWGQIYKNQKKRGYIIGGAFITSLIATGTSIYFEKDTHNKYLDSTTPNTIEENYKTYNSWFKKRKLFTITTISIWAVAILDALWAPYPQATLSVNKHNVSLSINLPLRK